MTFNFFSFLLGLIYSYILELSVTPIRNKWKKQANYNCSICKVFDCPYKTCEIKRKKYGSNN